MGLLKVDRVSVWGNATGNKLIFKWVKPEVEKNSNLVRDYSGERIVKEVTTIAIGETKKEILTFRSLENQSDDTIDEKKGVEFLAADSNINSYNFKYYWKTLNPDGSLPKGAFPVDAREYQQSNIYIGRRPGEGVGRVELKGDDWKFISCGGQEFFWGFFVLCNNKDW